MSASKKKRKATKQSPRAESSRQDSGKNTPATSNESTGPGQGIFDGVLMAVASALFVASPLVSEGTAEQCSNGFLLLGWFLLVAAICAKNLLTRQVAVVFGRVDIFFYGVCLWVAFSGLVSLWAQSGHARPTINMTWQWIGYAFAFFAFRQLTPIPSFKNVGVIAILTIAFGCSLAGIHQRYIVYPQLWANYEQQDESEKQESLRRGGISNVEPGSRERRMWENRLYATSPTSTFVLTNSLAIFLTVWLVVLFGILYWFLEARDFTTLIGLAIVAAAILFTLILTKSRTAYLASLFGVSVVTICFWGSRGSRIFSWRSIAVAGTIGVLLVGGAFAIGAVDVQVVTESLQSFSYRWEYWQASLQMIQDNPLLGCAPGNFQELYAKYQLPQASETVSDPHNFLIEIGSIAGLPALLGMIGLLAVWGASYFRIARRELSTNSGSEVCNHESGQNPAEVMNWSWLCIPSSVVLGLMISWVLANLDGKDSSLVLISGAIALVASLSTYQLSSVRIDRWTLGVAVLSAGIGLSASGGISFPSVAMSAIFLLALTSESITFATAPKKGEECTETGWEQLKRYHLVANLVLLTTSLAASFGLRSTVIGPIYSAREHAKIAEIELLSGNWPRALTRLDRAMEADPYDGNFLFFKLQIMNNVFKQAPSNIELLELQDLAKKALAARPNNSRLPLEIGRFFLSIALNPESLTEAEFASEIPDWFEEAVRRRPNDAFHAAYCAYAYAQLGNDEKAREWAQRALDLDKLNPHTDKALKNWPFQIEGIDSPLNIEQELEILRKK